MKDSNQNKKNQISRRGFLPLLGGGLLLPVLGFSKSKQDDSDENEEYQTLLRPDGTAVRVKKSVLENSKVIEKNISNKSLLGWLKNK
ncbi:hypothetical protein [Flavobacterium sp.]|uniref:hypothetical protein n=1 Tax=Flavobacterium sp. TaxID=239 RepID=UPI0037949B37